MTFKREMEKAIKGYLKPLGFKYVAKHFVHIRRCNDDISHSLGYADETHFRPHYYFLKTFVGVASIVLGVSSSCVPVFDEAIAVPFQNCTKEALYIGVSHYDNIDSVYDAMSPHYTLTATDTSGVYIWPKLAFKQYKILPDSSALLEMGCLPKDNDTCYCFIITDKDAKKYSWSKIREGKRYFKRIVTGNEMRHSSAEIQIKNLK